MCGIAAIFNYATGEPINSTELGKVLAQQSRRGPDGTGEWLGWQGAVGLGHRRLSIIDLSEAGAQPMISADGACAVTFNGEIYNYRELRADLERRGRHFRSGSDTEVLLHLYQLEGEAMLSKLRGMFAFAIWDDRRRGLLLARDGFGIKPLYYSNDGRTLRVASQVKALLAGGGVDTSPEPAGHVGFFLWGHVPSPYTLYRGIRGFPAGHSLWVDRHGTGPFKKFWSISGLLADAEAAGPLIHPAAEDSGRLRNALADSVRHHLIADVPVGVFLSAGLDSGTLAALASENSAALHTVTLGFNEYRGTPADEVPLAEQVARQYGTRHQTVWVSKQDFRSELGSLMGAMDQPSCDGVNSFFVSLAAARAGLKVALSGVGGDELFGGYASFLEIPRAAATFHSFQHCRPLGRMFRLVSAPILKRLTSPKYAGILEYGGTYSGAYLLRRGMFMPWELPEILDADLVREGWNELQTLVRLDETVQSLRSPHLKVSALEMTWYMGNQLLRDTDWASMHHSIEIRTPFVDTALLRSLAPQLLEPTPPTKQDMARTPRLALPDRVLHRPKTGFTVPVRQWLMNEDEEHPGERGLRGWVRHVYAAYHEDQEPAGPTGAALRPSPPRPRRRAAGKKKVLVFRIGQLGDTVVALPALWTVRKHFPDAELTLLCDRHPGRNFVIGADLLRDSGLFEKFEFYPVWPDGEHPATYAYEMVKLLQRLRRQHYDLLVYLMPSVRTRKQMLRDRRFFRMAGIKRFIGMTRIAELPEREPDRALCEVSHEAELLLARLAASGLPIPPAGQGSLNLKLAVKEQVEVSQWRGSLSGDAGRPRIAFGPGSKMSAKRWPAERFAEVGRLLIERYDIWPVVFGGPEDRPVAEELIRGWGRGHNAAGQLSLRGATQAMAGCRLYVGNDTGTMHLAAAAGICCVAIFSARDWPGRWHPYGPGHRILRTQIDCEGCGLVECLDRKNECLERITVGHVLAECEAALHASGTKVEKRN